ncbi:hypothetical protein Bpfe_011952 [Biomphalaria pfeifferi]|uniref:Uncharacterized protein n=1 Tax=Biomphalaria pfeifferi TaxID=112525 RepID=A0AAD8BPU9_BIOPF|nr:hypothetical protein Bpfe_011952 [Biomphalaria pfeifferi]
MATSSLTSAAKSQDYKTLIQLVQSGADVNIKDEEGNTSLYIILVLLTNTAINIPAVKTLLEKGATFEGFSNKDISEFFIKLPTTTECDLFELSLHQWKQRKLSPDDVYIHRTTFTEEFSDVPAIFLPLHGGSDWTIPISLGSFYLEATPTKADTLTDLNCLQH